MYNLRPYQQECLDAVKKELDRGVRKQLVVLPTGSGKTVVAAHMPKCIKPARVLFLAHREELIDQAYETFTKTYPDLRVGKEIGGTHASKDDHIVIGSVSTLGRSDNQRLKDIFEERKNSPHLIITDEAHHACAETYMRVYAYFGLNKSKGKHMSIGITATPFRGDFQKLSEVFDKITYTRKIGDMILEGYLCDIVAYHIQTDVDLSGVQVQAGDYATGQLSSVVNTEQRNSQIVQAYREYVRGEKAIIFCVDLKHAEDMNNVFNQEGIASRFVHGGTPKEERREIIEKYRSGEIKVLTNVGVLVEGFDAADTRSVIVARPTRSPVLYTQMVGRGLRTAEGKKNMILIDIFDRSEKGAVHSERIFNTPTSKCSYKEWKEAKNFLEEHFPSIPPDTVAKALKTYTVEDIKKKIKTMDILEIIQRAYDVGVDDFVKENSSMIWHKSSDGSYNIQSSHLGKLAIRENALGEWELWHKLPRQEWALAYQGEAKKCFSAGGKIISKHKKSPIHLRNAAWREQPPTEGQINFIQRLLGKRPMTSQPISKGEAAFIINCLLSEKRA